jgi:nucleoside-diphosphate-sugar epimerase
MRNQLEKDSVIGPARFGRPRILIVGCGDVGLRLARLVGDRFIVYGTTRDPGRVAQLRAAGVHPILLDLDKPWRAAQLDVGARHVFHLAPPSPNGNRDHRSQRLVAQLGHTASMCYVSTTGVYGNCDGQWVDETRPVAPGTERARRRVDAERLLRQWASRNSVRLVIVRVPGIYGPARLPIARIRQGVPALTMETDVYTNHIHADDLAEILCCAMLRGRANRVYNACDDKAMKMGDYFDLVAQHFGLPPCPRLPPEALRQRVTLTQWSFMRESRRIANRRITNELGARLAFTDVSAFLDQISEQLP